MLTVGAIFWLTLLAGLAAFWWQNDLVKTEALAVANSHCERLGLQFLDQSMVIKSIWPVRDGSGALRLQRRYRFEFSSTGEERYRGEIMLRGKRIESIELEPHVLP